MQLRYFVSGSSVILAAWLGVTFLHQVSAKRYPRLEKYPTAANRKPEAAQETADVAPETGTLTVSVSH